MAQAAMVNGIQVLPAGHEVSDHFRVPLAAGACLHDRVDLLGGHARPIGPGRHHRVTRVGNGQHARQQGNAFAGQSIGIPLAVDAFMMAAHARTQRGQLLDRADDAIADDRVFLNMGEFFRRQLARFSSTSSRMPILPMSWSRPAR